MEHVHDLAFLEQGNGIYCVDCDLRLEDDDLFAFVNGALSMVRQRDDLRQSLATMTEELHQANKEREQLRQ